MTRVFARFADSLKQLGRWWKSKATADTGPNLFQFWNTADPPLQVASLMQGWRDDPDVTYRRFDAESAETYIAEHIGERAARAYRQCAVPAMQADFFRYCVLYQEAGVYVDADTEKAGSLTELIAEAPRGMLMNRDRKIANDFMFFRNRHDPLLKAVIDQAIENIEGRISNNVWLVTGPGIMSRMYNSEPALKHLFEGFVIRPANIVRQTIRFRVDLDYKQSADDWRKNLGPGGVTIFRDV